jgi:hypothetical protein
VVEATSQVSRFHLETLEVTSKTSLQLQTVNISVNDKQLLSDAVLQLQGGVRYGLIGRSVNPQLAELLASQLVAFLTCSTLGAVHRVPRVHRVYRVHRVCTALITYDAPCRCLSACCFQQMSMKLCSSNICRAPEIDD